MVPGDAGSDVAGRVRGRKPTVGVSKQVVLVALPGVDLAAVEAEVAAQCDALPRGDVARQALSHSCIVVAADQVCRARPCCSLYLRG